MPEFVKRVLGMKAGEADARRRARAVSRARVRRGFPATQMEASIRQQVGEMGIDPLASGRITLDTGEREGKRSRAFCAPVRVPDEVYLVLRPHGGQIGLEHVPARARARAALRVHASRPRRSSIAGSATTRSPKATRCCSTISIEDAGWLKRYTELDASESARVHSRGGLRRAALPASLLGEADLRDRAVRRIDAVGVAARSLRRFADRRDDVPLRSRRRVRRRRSALLCGALSACVAAAGADHRDARRAIRRRLVAESARGSVDRARRCSAKGSASWRTSRRERVAGKPLSFAPLVRAVERMLS